MNKGTRVLLGVLAISMLIGFFWNSMPFVKETIHLILDPSAGKLLNWNINLGMIIITFIISFILSLFQKYTIDQETLRTLKKEQKLLQEEMKKYKDNPEKLMEFQKKQLEFIPKTFDLTMRPLLYTAIPIILFFRWFSDYFTALSSPLKILGFFSTSGSWIWAYLILSIIFSSIFRKVLKLA